VVGDIVYKLSLVEGVASIVPPDDAKGSPIVITNKWSKDNNYSGNIYDIDSATKNGVVYPSLDPSIFELKFPSTDILGRVVGSI